MTDFGILAAKGASIWTISICYVRCSHGLWRLYRSYWLLYIIARIRILCHLSSFFCVQCRISWRPS